jgi:DNA mismatch repair protein MutS
MRYSDQTCYDCNLSGHSNRRQGRSVFDVFNRTSTAGGAAALQEMLLHKKSTPHEIYEVHLAVRYAIKHAGSINLRLNNSEINYLGEYFRLNLVSQKTGSTFNLRLFYRASGDPTYNFIRSNIIRLVIFLREVAVKFARLPGEPPTLIRAQVEMIRSVVNDKRISELITTDIQKVNRSFMLKADNFLRHEFRLSFNHLLDAVYNLEAYASIATTAVALNLSFPQINNNEPFTVTGAYHLLIKEPVANDVSMAPRHSLMFLTGANMAGKSTFFRTIATIVVLAQAGFPVPAATASMPFYDQVDVRISAGDDLSHGYSHFYSEIIAVNNLLKCVAAKQRCFSVFDEVFSGTNINDASECMKIFMGRLANADGTLVFVSSHNIQLAGAGSQTHVKYNFIETFLQNDEPVFTYRLLEGVNEIRLGLLLFRQLQITNA